ncbi:hypothetical protein MBLNU13_g03105t1 [Cladosporium sp. NU13]
MAPAAPSTVKLPYWARDEDDDQRQGSQPMATPIIRRKPVGMGPQATTTPNTSIAPTPLSIPRKPVPTPPAAEPVLAFKPVDGNQYHTAPVQQWDNQSRPDTAVPVAQVHVDNVAQQSEIPLSPELQAAPIKKSKANGVLSRGFGTIRKAAGHAMRSPAADGPKISTPVAGSFHRSGLNSPVVMETPLQLVGLEVAQADVPRYGKPDHLLESPRTVGPRPHSLSWLTNEPVPTQPPAAPAAPAASAPKRSASRKVVNEADRQTLFGDIIAAAQDSSWVNEPEPQAKGSAPREEKGKDRVASLKKAPTMPPSFTIPSAGNPFAARPRQPVNFDKSLPSSPAPGSMRRQITVTNPVQPAPQYTSRFQEALESDGGRRASYVPGIKCSDCGKMIDAVQVADHRCGERAAQAVDRDDWQPAGLSRADTYTANYGRPPRLSPATTWGRDCMQSLSGLQGHETGFVDDGVEPDVVVDTFVRGNHTSWRGVVNLGVGSDVHSLRGHISGGSDEVRRSNEVEQANFWRNRASKMG